MIGWPNQRAEPTEGSRFCPSALVSQWRLPPEAHACVRWTAPPIAYIFDSTVSASLEDGDLITRVLES